MTEQTDLFTDDLRSDTPTIHVTNWASRKLHGPGQKWTIMAKPRRWEHGEGAVVLLIPEAHDVTEAKAGRLSMAAYRAQYREKFIERLGRKHQLQVGILSPGQLKARTRSNDTEVKDGDTLCCACSKATAADRKCHRVWAAELLKEGGWRVVLDGVEI